MTIAAIDFQMLANAGYPPTRFAAGDVIFSEGDKGDVMYVVRSGEVSIEHQGTSWRPLGEAVSSVRWL
jgi:CRP-like cAMP-binding protein